uniref:BCAS3 domain-containing protein n=1 Tax=Prymnesium polylepis TaxID=72548 RepID=A0A7S4MS39_9EUKA|mmetsp:Transcript_34860/g.87653  ORF Transcript_34860/g.87653 Transcript_34860/m.87653 type:complete len:145 (+) Transcript_34860:3-437(+)
MKTSVETLAKQGRYDEAHKLKKKADQLEKWERMKLENEHNTYIANKELQMRQQHQLQLEALRRRIQRGREEHKEHWLLGAQRLMQSHRNMISDLKSKQAIESMRADVAVKLDMSANRSAIAKEKIKANYAGVKPRVPGPSQARR